MDDLTKLIKTEIKRQYKSVKNFSEVSGIAYSTLANAINKGFGLSAYHTVTKIMNILHLRQEFTTPEEPVIYSQKFKDMSKMFFELDKKGQHTVETVLRVEYQRSLLESKSARGVLSFGGNMLLPEDEEVARQLEIKRTLEKIKESEEN